MKTFGISVAEDVLRRRIDFGMSMADLQNQTIVKELTSRGASIEQIRRFQQLGGARNILIGKVNSKHS